ncbi:uncharacterized protein TRIVIDRAFT_192046 [Trichoderma virens Gv29-8]|uniref:Uncharacterized protein n=1 Tax=Hypocrea virens (strain Gv29-8 / FGSC 10586) TaxID=413071 RepID=G9MVD2_HYPVG|nr:uncharacterized protein TRIVIDRAFT_192046 [Trichoderma virens Gv29-8]EHK21558.1 hypothetical protein TRIVIDRAFT_192046 [Trichoderma virens Gv29-8]UKZ54416.1 hypothetical protein TrVGV298_008224 [Trichoderma virens]
MKPQLFAFVSTLLCVCNIPLASSAYRDHTYLIYEFPNDTWVENIAARSNGELLLSIVGKPQLFAIDPSAPSPRQPVLIHEFTGFLDVFGIAEYQTDKFAVLTGNFSLETGDLGIGSWAVWSVDLTGVEISLQDGDTVSFPGPKITKITDIPAAHFLNGLSLLSPEQQTLLIGDINAGVIYRLDIGSGDYEIVLNDTFTAPVPTPPFPISGVDGLHVRNGSELFFSNFGKQQLYKVAINEDGTPAGPVVTVANTLSTLDEYDDFTFDCDGNIFITTGGGNSIEKISTDGLQQVIIAGNVNSTALAEPTSCVFGRGLNDRNVLYVVTGGGLALPVNGDVIMGGQLVAIKTNTNGSAC